MFYSSGIYFILILIYAFEKIYQGGDFQLHLMNVCCPTLGKLTRIFAPWSNPHPLPALPPHGVYIDRCITQRAKHRSRNKYSKKPLWLTTPLSSPQAVQWKNSSLKIFSFYLVASFFSLEEHGRKFADVVMSRTFTQQFSFARATAIP